MEGNGKSKTKGIDRQCRHIGGNERQLEPLLVIHE